MRRWCALAGKETKKGKNWKDFILLNTQAWEEEMPPNWAGLMWLFFFSVLCIAILHICCFRFKTPQNLSMANFNRKQLALALQSWEKGRSRGIGHMSGEGADHLSNRHLEMDHGSQSGPCYSEWGLQTHTDKPVGITLNSVHIQQNPTCSQKWEEKSGYPPLHHPREKTVKIH